MLIVGVTYSQAPPPLLQDTFLPSQWKIPIFPTHHPEEVCNELLCGMMAPAGIILMILTTSMSDLTCFEYEPDEGRQTADGTGTGKMAQSLLVFDI